MIGLLLAGCTHAVEDTDLASGSDSGPDSGPEYSDAACDDAPLLTWDNFGAGFLTENCQACHASTSMNRYGAPEDVVFDTSTEAWFFRALILERTTGESPSMPPAGGVTEWDQYKLWIWLTCSVYGT